MNGDDIRHAMRQCCDFLAPVTDRGWDVPVPDLEWSVAFTVGHAAQCCLWYATDLAASDKRLGTVDMTIGLEQGPQALVDTPEACATVLGHVVDATPDTARGWHPFGWADPAGYAAMACDEMFVHTDDAARGLGVEFVPDADLCRRTVARLFRDEAPRENDVEPWTALRWCNGRLALPGRPRRERWRWHSAPEGAA